MNVFFRELITNKVFLSGVCGWAAAQALKIIIEIIHGTFTWQRLSGAGGMPSTHSATTSAIAASVCIQDGPGSSGFVIALFLAFIVMYDSIGVRYVTGEQSERLNKLTNEKPPLPEKMGHTLSETVVGCLIGIVIGILLTALLPF